MTRAREPHAEGFVERASVIHPGLAPDLVYLDYNATTPVDPRVVEAMLPYLTTHFGNPSSAHAYAAAPRQWWMPCPKARWVVPVRPMSNVCASVLRSGSRPAAANDTST